MRYILSLMLVLFVTSCSVPNRFVVSELGYDMPESLSSEVYYLPQTSIKTNLQFQKDVFIPGPYADYALKLLGISGVQKDRMESHSITSISMDAYNEADPSHFYIINCLEGGFNPLYLEQLQQKGYILTGFDPIEIEFSNHQMSEMDADLHFTDVSMESNQEVRRETIYKTILTDTSFLRVPVTTEQMESKTLEKKAEEAANLILEIRSDRYYISAGLLDPYPVNFDVKTALNQLDRLEEEYLSLFIGKSYKEHYYREYLVFPEGSVETEDFVLARFSPVKGIGQEGELVKLVLTPGGNTESLRNLLPQLPETDAENRLYYRLPGVCDANILLGEMSLFTRRMNVFQSGALVNLKIEQ